jgi:hypothetical protein
MRWAGKGDPVPDETLPTAQEIERRKQLADALKAEADAKRAEAEARKAEEEARKAKLDADAAEKTPGEKEAAARRAIAVDDGEAAAARRKELAALVPDLTDVTQSTVEAKEGSGIGANPITFGALGVIGESVAEAFGSAKVHWEGAAVLVTSDADLATSDARYREVSNGLDQLACAAGRLLETEPPETEALLALPVDLVATIAAAVPSVLSMFSAQRTLTTGAVNATDLAAAAGVAGALVKKYPELPVVHDTFRLVEDGPVYAALELVTERRQQLVAHKIELTDRKNRAADAVEKAVTALEKAEKALADAGSNASGELKDAAVAARAALAAEQQRAESNAVRLSLTDSLVQSIDTFTAAISTTPAGASRSLLATAALYEQLHRRADDDHNPAFGHVLLVKAQGGQSQQMLENRPLMMGDRYSTVVDLSVTYILISTSASRIVAAGTTTAAGTAWGKVGELPETHVQLIESGNHRQ